jgi:hypothetical protein
MAAASVVSCCTVVILAGEQAEKWAGTLREKVLAASGL